MIDPVQLYAWHFMSYPHLPADFDEKYDTGWVTVPNKLWDKEQVARPLQRIYRPARPRRRARLRRHGAERASPEYLRPDAVAQHHRRGADPEHQARQDRRAGQSAAAACESAARRRRIRHARPHERWPLDRRLRAGLAARKHSTTTCRRRPRATSSGKPPISSSAPGPTMARSPYEGEHFPLRYVNPWPQPMQRPYPPIWIPGARPKRHADADRQARLLLFPLLAQPWRRDAKAPQQQFAEVLKAHGDKYHPFSMGILMSTYVARPTRSAQKECEEGIWYFLRNCLKGHQRREGRQLTFGPGVPYIPAAALRDISTDSDPRRRCSATRRTGTICKLAVDHRRQPDTVLPALHGHAARKPRSAIC